MVITNLYWVKYQNGNWCELAHVNLANVNTLGVYVIWSPRSLPWRAIRVGQGNIKDRLNDHRNNPEIMRYGNDLRVTWAQVGSLGLDGVERYLAEHYRPIVGDRFPNVPPIPVNVPF